MCRVQGVPSLPFSALVTIGMEPTTIFQKSMTTEAGILLRGTL